MPSFCSGRQTIGHLSTSQVEFPAISLHTVNKEGLNWEESDMKVRWLKLPEKGIFNLSISYK